MEDGQRIYEDLQVLETFCESGDWAEQKPFLLTLAGMIGAILKQESIACAIDGRMEIVPPIRAKRTEDLNAFLVELCTAGGYERAWDRIARFELGVSTTLGGGTGDNRVRSAGAILGKQKDQSGGEGASEHVPEGGEISGGPCDRIPALLGGLISCGQ